jgi:hypothetical protein
MPDGLAITYMTDQLEFSGAENGIAILIMLLCVVTVVTFCCLSFPHPPLFVLLASVPGGLLSGFCSARFNPIRSSMMAVTIFDNTAFVSSLRDQINRPSIHSGRALGIGTGAKWTSDRMLFARIAGQNAELSGGYVFSAVANMAPAGIYPAERV